jgi:DNA-binding NtrC family response regulator
VRRIRLRLGGLFGAAERSDRLKVAPSLEGAANATTAAGANATQRRLRRGANAAQRRYRGRRKRSAAAAAVTPRAIARHGGQRSAARHGLRRGEARSDRSVASGHARGSDGTSIAIRDRRERPQLEDLEPAFPEQENLRMRPNEQRRTIVKALPFAPPAMRQAHRNGGEREQRRARFSAYGILTASPSMDQVLDLVERVARSQAGVLVEGETGTGKELIVRAIHVLSGRSPYVALNCAALPESLLESELFGHERGAFTGADRARSGLIAQASGGTLFLDEVSETSLAIQAKLLRVLQEKEVRPLGGSSTRRVDVRFVAAANVDMREACAQGRFRMDLYHRLAVVPISLPPLRERVGDLPILIQHFLARSSTDENRCLAGFAPDALRVLEQYRWPGNVRELQNEIHRIVICCADTKVVRAEAISPWIARRGTQSPVDGRALRDVLHELEIATIVARLEQHGYRRTATARSLGITREALWAKLRRFGLGTTLGRSRVAHAGSGDVSQLQESLEPTVREIAVGST